jgi:large subunit ribosomal protein L6
MSRVGKLPIAVPSGVTITVDDDFVTVTGPKGTLKQFTVPGISYKLEDGEFVLSRESEVQLHRANHGLMRALVNNMVVGVTTGFTKKLEINGVGYRAAMEGNKVKFQLGYSHDILFPIPEGIKIEIEQNVVTVSGISKQQVGQVAAEIRALRKPEPYKGKGIKYSDERIIRKSGKSGKDK